MLNICICEEDHEYVDRIKNKLEEVLEGVPYLVSHLDTLEEIEEQITIGLDYDIIIIAVQFSKKTSLKTISHINQKYPNIQIIIMSKYIGMLMNVFDVECCYCIYKEELDHRLDKAIAKARHNLADYPKYLVIKDSKEHIIVKCKDIIYIEHLQKKCTIHTITDKIEIVSTLKELEVYLNPTTFFHTHKSYIVNSDHIKRISLTKLEVTGGITLPVSRNYRQQIRSFIEYHTRPVNE